MVISGHDRVDESPGVQHDGTVGPRRPATTEEIRRFHRSTVARVAGVSIAQAARVLPDLVERDLRPLLPLKTTTEYEPEDVRRSIHQILREINLPELVVN